MLKQYDITTDAQVSQGWQQCALAGCIATVPMTIFMLATQRLLPKGQQYDLPPELLTKEVARRAHVKVKMSKGQILAATLFAHFGYGTVMGMVYHVLDKSLGNRVVLPAALKGGIFGFIVWAASYFGLSPLVGFSESGHSETGRRNLMMIVAHLIWGTSLGIVAAALSKL